MSEIRVENIIGETGTDAVKFTKGINVTGVTTATSFSGSGANLTSLPAANLTGTLPAISGANLTNLPGVTVGSPVSLGTGTYKDITIDSTNVYKIELVFYEVSVSGNTDFGFQLINSGGPSGSGYKAAAAYFSNASYAGNNMRTDSFRWTGLAGASNVMNGQITFYKYDTNIYFAQGIAMKSDSSDATQYFVTGTKNLGAALTGIRMIASSNLSTNFDGGYYKLITHST